MATCDKIQTPTNVAAADTPPKEKNEIAMNVMSILLEKNGMTLEAAAGFCGNFRAESGWNPSAIGDNGTSIGIAQWHASRMKALKAAYPNGYNDYRNQAKFVLKELDNGYKNVWNRVKGTENVNEATRVVMDYYETPQVCLNKNTNPGAYKKELNKRISYAVEILNSYKKYKGIE